MKDTPESLSKDLALFTNYFFFGTRHEMTPNQQADRQTGSSNRRGVFFLFNILCFLS